MDSHNTDDSQYGVVPILGRLRMVSQYGGVSQVYTVPILSSLRGIAKGPVLATKGLFPPLILNG